MLSIQPNDLPTAQLHGHLLGAISPRPICFASTVDEHGRPNLSPFSFFNIFGSNPVTFIFSPARRVRDNTLKHTLLNCIATKEVVINVVNYAMVQQMSLSSCEYAEGVNEFEKAGFTMLASDCVKPFRVAESPVQIECIVKEVIETGKEGGAGNLIVAEMLKMHINENILDAKGTIDPHKIDVVGRMGKDFYVRASGSAVFEVEKPNSKCGIGIDALPQHIRESSILSGNDLGILGNVEVMPVLDENFSNIAAASISLFEKNKLEKLHLLAKDLIAKGEVQNAWQVLLQKINE